MNLTRLLLPLLLSLLLRPAAAGAQAAADSITGGKTVAGKTVAEADSTFLRAAAEEHPLASDSIAREMEKRFQQIDSDAVRQDKDAADSITAFALSTPKRRPQRDWATWHPDPQRALWLALVIPGGGQIYNRKYWKLPIVYGGFVGCIYAMSWNNMMYHDYQQAYLDIMDDDPATASYNKFLHLGRQITSQNEERYKQIFKSRKDKYRRWRDLSFFVMVGVYAVSVIDAYIDAELSDFDISKDLSMKVRPTVIGNQASANPLMATSIGLNCSLNF